MRTPRCRYAFWICRDGVRDAGDEQQRVWPNERGWKTTSASPRSRISFRAHAADMNAIANALLAVLAADAGDTAAAREHVSTAQLQSRATARRNRQVVEIAALIVSGDRTRAAGLSLIHASEFPDDRELLARITNLTTDGA